MSNLYLVDNLYFTKEEDAIKYVESLYGKIVKFNAINKRNQKLVCNKNNSLTKVTIKMVDICTNANTSK